MGSRFKFQWLIGLVVLAMLAAAGGSCARRKWRSPARCLDRGNAGQAKWNADAFSGDRIGWRVGWSAKASGAAPEALADRKVAGGNCWDYC